MTIILDAPASSRILLQARSYKPGASTITLIDASGATTGYALLGEPDWGNAVWDLIYSGTRGTRGARAVGGTLPNRTPSFSLRVTGSTKDDLMAKLSTLKQLASEWRRFGGQLIWRSKNQTYRQIFEVLAGNVAVNPWQTRAEHSNLQDVSIAFAAEPYLLGDPYDIVDPFDADNGDYTLDTGTASDLTITGGQLTSVANHTVEKRLIHTSRGYLYGDCQATINGVAGSSAFADLKVGVILKRLDASNYLELYLQDKSSAPTKTQLKIDKVVGGVRTNLAIVDLAARISFGEIFWVRGRIEGVQVYVEHFSYALAGAKGVGIIFEPTPMVAPTTSTSYTLTSAEQAAFGPTATGFAGFSWNPQDSTAILDDFIVRPYTYRNLTLPDELRLNGAIVGDAPALVDAYITPSGGAAAPIWAALGWWQRPGLFNLCGNGDFENAQILTGGWSVAAVTNIIGAATSITRITTAAKYGTCSGRIVCPATSATGASFRIFRRFKKGVTYTAECWIHAASATTTVQIRIGNSAANEVAGGTAIALSSSWQRITVTWTPSADRDDAHVAVNITAATATTFEIDGVMVYEGTVAPTSANQSEGRGGFPPVGVIECENSILSSTVSANANFRSGFGATGQPALMNVLIDPTLLSPDDFTQSELAIEVWLRCDITAGLDPSLQFWAESVSASQGVSTIYSEEFGSTGKSAVLPSASTVRRVVRLGTLRLPTGGGRYILHLSAGTGVSNAITLDYLVLVPAASRALSPTAKASSGFPKFVPATTEITKRIRADLSGTIKEAGTGVAETATNGLGGALIEAPPGNVDAVLKLSSLIPDDPTVNASDEQLAHSATVHLSVTPRYEEARPS